MLPAVEDVDLIVTSSVATRYAALPESTRSEVVDAFETTYRTWVDAGIPVIVIADDPGPSRSAADVLQCVAAHADDDDPCTAARSDVLEFDAQVAAASRFRPEELTLVDLTDGYCDATTCHAVVGGLVVYLGGSHLSVAFSESLAPYLEGPLLDALARGDRATST